MQNIQFYAYIRKQIPVLNVLSVFPGIAYVIFGYLNDLLLSGFLWYVTLCITAIWGHLLYKHYTEKSMTKDEKTVWYRKVRFYFYIMFGLWTVVFILFSPYPETKIHYIAIFTQIGASVVASTLLFPDKKIFTPVLLILILPLSVYFFFIGELYGYILTIFSIVLLTVLFYSAFSSNKLIHKTKIQASMDMLFVQSQKLSLVEILQLQ
jgi:hypothetical protein